MAAKTPAVWTIVARVLANLLFAGLALCRPALGGDDLLVLSPHVAVYRGVTNVGIIHDGEKAVLIDCGDGRVSQVLERLGIAKVEAVYFTHYHRDTSCGGTGFASKDAKVLVPATERHLFDGVDSYWRDAKNRWHLYKLRPGHLVLAEPLKVDGELTEGRTVEWGPARITALATPGHTDGSMSLLIEADGRRFVFCGDMLYDSGKLWNVWSLQRGGKNSDYHGYLGARQQLQQSFQRIKNSRPDRLVPSHGQIMTEPLEAMDLATRRLENLYNCYVEIAALRYYMPEVFKAYANKPRQMPLRPGKEVPSCLRHIGTTWMLLSKDKSAFVMDAGTEKAVAKVQAMLKAGEITSVDGLWITHYHDDHVDGIPTFQKMFPRCPCIAVRAVAEVIRNPMGWRLPCISPAVARVDRASNDGESWPWREYRLTAYHFPGQTLYHGGLFVEGEGVRMLFVGDSFTPGGIDDYCMQNRNWLGPNVGFDGCIQLIEKLRPTHIFNCHVGVAFDFGEEDCRFMRANLVERERLIREIVPWDHANYATDESWIRCYPYEQKAKPGEAVAVEVVVTNHSSQARAASCRAVLPAAWSKAAAGATWATWIGPDSARAEIPGKSEGRIRLNLSVPLTATPGRYVIPVDVQYGDWRLPQIAEAIVEL